MAHGSELINQNMIERRLKRIAAKIAAEPEDEMEILPTKDPGEPVFVLNKTTGAKISLRKYHRILEKNKARK